jgi:chemotaxis family two-component system sensor kinase Cph1
MPTFLQKLFDTSDFPARWECGNWDAFHGWLHIVSDLAIWGAYFMIPFALLYYWWKKRQEMEFPKLFWLFGAFIFSCGITHFIDAVIFYQPVYRLSGLMKSITAVVSWMTVFAIIRIAPQALTLPGRARLSEELQRQLDIRHEMQERLAESNRALEAYTGQVSHDLRNPISGLIMLGSLAVESARKGDSATAADQVSMMLNALERMEDSVKELHSLSRVRDKGAHLKPVNLAMIVGIVRENLSREITDSGAQLNVHRLPTVPGKETLLIHLFTNLLENSMKYRGEAAPEIIIESRSEPGWEVVTVADNGRGIPPDELEKVFGANFRASNSKDIDGSGIGLSLCVSIMDGHSGSIRALRSSGAGTTVEMRFPALA